MFAANRFGAVLALTVGAALCAAPSSCPGAAHPPTAAPGAVDTGAHGRTIARTGTGAQRTGDAESSAWPGRLRGRRLVLEVPAGTPTADAAPTVTSSVAPLAPARSVPWERKVQRALAAVSVTGPVHGAPRDVRGDDVSLPSHPASPAFAPAFLPTGDGSPVEYVIVTSEAMAAEFQRLADWKTQKGVRSVVRTTEWIDVTYPAGVDRAERIRLFLRDAYEHWGTLWLLLGGDTGVIPARYAASVFQSPTGEPELIPADLYYACLDGDWNGDGDALFGEAIPPGQPAGGDDADLLPELWVGRAPVLGPVEAAVFVDRVLDYERDPPIDGLYPGSLLLLGEILAAQLDGAAFCEEVAALAPPTTRAVRLYQNHEQYPGALPENIDVVVDSLEAGFGIVDHVGHGYRTTMSVGVGSLDNSAASALTNGGRLSAIVAINCASGAFDFNAIGEQFLRNPDGGAIAFIGMARTAVPTPSHDFQMEFFARLWGDSLTATGATLAMARVALVPLSGPGESAHRWNQLALNLLGDPETPLWTRAPGRLTATHASSVELGATGFGVTVEVDGAPIAGATVCLHKEDAYSVGETGLDGAVVLPWDPPSIGSFDVTATLRGAVPARSNAEVVSSSATVLTAGSVIVDDASGGNGDGRADQGESFDLEIMVHNAGGQPATGASAGLSDVPELVQVHGGSAALGNIPAGDSLAAVFPVTIAAAVPPGSKPVLDLDLQWDTGAVSRTVVLPLYTPELVHRDHALDDSPPSGNGNGMPEPGERIRWWPTVQNLGNGTATLVTASLRVLDRHAGEPHPQVAVDDSVVVIGDLLPLGSGTGGAGDRFDFTLPPGVMPGDLWLELRLADQVATGVIARLDLEPPSTPTGLVAIGGSSTVALTWEPVAVDDLLGYDVYRGVSAFGPFERLNLVPLTAGSRYDDTGLPGFATFYYAVTARDSSCNASPRSTALGVATGPPLKAGWPIAMAREGSAAVVTEDLDGVPGLEIVTGSDAVYVWHADGAELRDGDQNSQTHGVFTADGRSVGRGFLATPAIADLDQDGDLDIVASAWDGRAVYAWDAAGDTLPGWPQQLEHDFNWSTPVVDDLDLDGDYEVLAVSGKLGKLYGWHHDGTEIRDGDANPSTHGVLFVTGTTFLYATPAVGDVDGDPYPEIVLGANYVEGPLHVLDHRGIEQPGFPRQLDGQITASAALADLDDDGRLDIVIAAESDLVFVIDGISGADLPGWPRPAANGSQFARTSSPVVCDLDLDGGLDVVYAASDGRMHAWRRTGTVLPGWDDVRFGDYPIDATQCTPTIADIDGDGTLDVLLGAEDGLVHAWNADGSPLGGFPLATDGEVRGAVAIWDVDEDGDLEMCTTSFDRQVYLWELAGPLRLDRVGWPFMRRDIRNTGRLGEDFMAIAVSEEAGGPAGVGAPRLVLRPPMPNPTAAGAWLVFDLPGGSGVDGRSARGPRPVRLGLYDVQGRLVRRVVEATLEGGTHRVRWDGRDANGRALASGIYFMRLEMDGATRIGKLTILR